MSTPLPRPQGRPLASKLPPRPLPHNVDPAAPPPRPQGHSSSWSRAFARARRPRTLIFFILPTALALTVYDPLNMSDKVRDKVEEVIPTSGGRKLGTVPPLEERNMTARQRSAVEAALAERARARAAAAEIEAGQKEATQPAAAAAVGQAGEGASETGKEKRRFAPWNSLFGKGGSASQAQEASPIPPQPKSVTYQPPDGQTGQSPAGGSAMDGLRVIRSNVVIKQHEMNAVYGGIHPLKAQGLHAQNIPRAIAQALKEADMRLDEMDAVAYTRGPGMLGCLNVCAGAAKALAAAHGLPLLGVHHMQAHALTPLLTEETPPKFPFLVVLVSGGHTQLVLARSFHEYRIIADCLDSKIGDAYDKVARLLQLPTSTQASGAVLEHFASLPPLPPFDSDLLPTLPRPLSSGQHAASLQFSFSGLVSHVERVVARLHPLTDAARTGETGQSLKAASRVEGEKAIRVDEATQRELSRLFQDAAIGHLTSKVSLALSSPDLKGVRGVVVSGGVASNQALRNRLRDALARTGRQIDLYYPPISLCTDNAAMIAWTAILRLQDGAQGEGFDLPLRPKWSLADLYDDVA